jgi:hypothetical protein
MTAQDHANQLASKITTLLAAWRLMPMFPAIVETRNNLQIGDLIRSSERERDRER